METHPCLRIFETVQDLESPLSPTSTNVQIRPPRSTSFIENGSPLSGTSGVSEHDNSLIDAREIIQEMKQACDTAISTLNDVLLYDKIEGGTMALEKRPISVMQLLSQAIRPFFIQVCLIDMSSPSTGEIREDTFIIGQQ